MTEVTKAVSSTGGMKERGGDRLRYDLIPVRAVREEALVYTIGAKKYEDHNWRNGMPWSECIGPLLRHLMKWLMGEQRDPEGQHHLASVKFWCNALIEYEVTHPKLDDRRDKGILNGTQETSS